MTTKERIRTWIKVDYNLLVVGVVKARSHKTTIWQVVEKLLRKWVNGEIEVE